MIETTKIFNRINLNCELNRVTNNNDISFRSVLDKKIEDLKFSKHSLTRMEMRNLKISQSEYSKLIDAVNKASAKGIKDSLIIMDDKAFIVNLKNKTVITAVDGQTLKNSVFTNIDGAVII